VHQASRKKGKKKKKKGNVEFLKYNRRVFERGVEFHPLIWKKKPEKRDLRARFRRGGEEIDWQALFFSPLSLLTDSDGGKKKKKKREVIHIRQNSRKGDAARTNG